MSNSLKLKWDKETFLEGAKIAYDYDMKHSWRRYAGWFFIALTQFGVVAAIRGGAIGLLLISTLLVIYWYGMRWPLRRRMLLRFFSKEKMAEQTLEVTYGKEELCLNDICIPWKNFQRVLLAPKGYLMEMKGGTFIYLPKRIFPDEDNRSAFVNRLRKNINNVLKIDSK